MMIAYFYGFLSQAWDFFLEYGIYLVPIFLAIAAWKAWMKYINYKFLHGLKWVMIEVRLPKEIRRSPLAMEIVLNSFHQTGGTGNWFQKYWLGNLRATFSLEIVSIEGKIHFFIRTQKRFRNAIESYIYAQYPEVEILEVPDYVDKAYYTEGGDWSLWANEFVLSKPDPYPIKTYIDYGLDKNLKEEEKIDPITPMIELMGSMKQGEQLWFQIIIRAAADNYKLKNKWFKKGSWKDEAKDEIDKIKEKATDPTTGKFNTSLITPGQKEVIEALERNTAKFGFDVGIRTIYIAKRDNFDGSHIGAVTNMLKQYNSQSLNGFRPANVTAVDYPWEDYIAYPDSSPDAPFFSLEGKRVEAKRLNLFNFYRNRSYFYSPDNDNRKVSVLSTEELATIYHFPGGVSETPSFARIEAKKSEPPVNLPL